MVKVIRSPGKYVQGPHLFEKGGEYIKDFASNCLILASPSAFERSNTVLGKSLSENGVKFSTVKFNRECSKNEINRLVALMKQEKCDAVVGIGGGKALDTAKAVAFHCKTPVIIVPTIASTDAPCSALSVVYTDDGVFEEYLLLPRNPDLVLVDTYVIANAPARLLVAGIGDALATWFEARATAESFGTAMAGGQPTVTSLTIAQTCYHTLLEEGLKAKLAAERKVVTEAVDRVVEANTYLSGIGFESGGLAAAHAVHNGLTAIAETHDIYHGEKVSFGVLVQLMLENAPLEELEEVCEFCRSVNLPLTLAELNIKEDIEKKMKIVAEAACAPGETIHNMPFPVTVDNVYAALLSADSFGKMYQI